MSHAARLLKKVTYTFTRLYEIAYKPWKSQTPANKLQEYILKQGTYIPHELRETNFSKRSKK